MASRQLRPGFIGSKLRALAAYDMFPVFSAKVRRVLYNPLGVLILAAAAAFLCGLYLHTQGFALLGGLLLVILLGITWPWLSLLGLRGSVTFDRPRSCEGERTEVRAILRNRLPWASYGLTVEGFQDARGVQGDSPIAGLGIASAPGWRTIRCRWSFTPSTRGVYPLRVPRLTTAFPFGLWKSKRPLSSPASLVVWPRTYPVLPAPQLNVEQQIEGNFSPHKVGTGGDVLGVRPYRRGDSLRRIHWSQTARHDRLIVCEFQSNARPRIQLILDADPRVHAGHGPDGSREWAIRIVASLARGWLEAGVAVGAVWDGTAVKPASGAPQGNMVLDSLAKLPDSTETSLGELLTQPICRDFDNGLQIIVTTDQALQNARLSQGRNDRRRWVLLQAQAFDRSRVQETHASRLPIRPWILIAGPDRVPALLLGESNEARHGF
jgi:uncharacterized protein (DUF58 family)